MFLVSLFERCACARRCNKLVVAFAVLLDYAPTHALGSGGFFTAEQAVPIAKLPPLDGEVITAVTALFPV